MVQRTKLNLKHIGKQEKHGPIVFKKWQCIVAKESHMKIVAEGEGIQ